MPGLFRFPAEHRLHAGPQFDRAYREGRRAGDGLFAVNAVANSTGHARLGMSVSTKTVGNAVNRNRVRRLIRDVFRHARPQLPALDYVVTSRPGARTAPRDALLGSLERLIADATRRAQQKSPP